jgi:hypothetical protein
MAVPAGAADAEALRLKPPVRQGAQLLLEWSGGIPPFQLEQGPAVTGPWLAIGQVTTNNSTRVPATLPKQFFRVTDGSAGGEPTGASIQATLDALAAFVNTVPATNRQEWQTNILAFLKGRSDINSFGSNLDGIWALTQDGIPLAFWNNRRPDPFDPEDAASPVALAGTETPGKNLARFSTTVGAGFTLAAPRLARQLAGNGYVTTSDNGALTSLRGTRNEAVFFFNTHGGLFQAPRYDASGKAIILPDGTHASDPVFGLWTDKQVNFNIADPDFSVAEFKQEFRAKRLGIVLAAAFYTPDSRGNLTVPVNQWRYGITDAWVRKYLKYPKENHASIWIAACQSGSAAAASMRSAFQEVGAELVSSWTQNIDGASVANATLFLFDRLLGANRFVPPATPQRPFDYEKSWAELRSRGLHRYPTVDDKGNATTTEIVFQGAAGDEAFGLFAPSIEYCLVDEAENKLHLKGLFGKPPEADQQVMIGGTSAAISSWDYREIICSLAESGAGSAGDVQVIARGHKSNIRRISRWTVHATYKMTEPETPHEINGTWSLVFRADVGEYRKEPGNVFIRPTRYATGARVSDVQMKATGVGTHPCDKTKSEKITWLGSESIPTQDPNSAGMTIAILGLDTAANIGSLGVTFGIRDVDNFPLKVKVEPCDAPAMTFALAPGPTGPVAISEPLMFGWPLEETFPDGSRILFPLPGGSFFFGSDWAVNQGNAQSELDSGMQWSAAAAEFPPDPQAAR